MKLYIVRHGKTWFNVIGRIQGWCDSPLTEKGREQAKKLRLFFDTVSLSAGYYSGSERAGDTLELILHDRNIPIHKDKRFKEVFFGDYEAEYTKTIFPDGVVNPEVFYEHGGENRHDAAQRFLSACKEISKKETGDVLIVSHGSIIRQFLEENSEAFRQLAATKNLTKALVPNCSVSIVEIENENIDVIQLPTVYQ